MDFDGESVTDVSLLILVLLGYPKPIFPLTLKYSTYGDVRWKDRKSLVFTFSTGDNYIFLL